MAPKLTSRQLAQLGFLETLPPKFERWHNIVEQMASLQADEATVRNLCRSLDETKTQAGTLNLTGLGDTMGMMAMLARRSGGLQMKVRGLREGLVSLKTNFDGSMRAASTPEPAGGRAENESGAL